MSWIGSLQSVIGEIVPWWLRAQHTGTFLESVGLTLDGAQEALYQGMRLSQPTRCDSSALPYLSSDRGIRVYPTEPVDSQRYRLAQWWALRRQFGTHQGEMRNLQPYFLPGTLPLMRIVHQDGAGASATWHTLTGAGAYSWHRATPSNWDWDGATAKWSRFWCVLDVSALGLPAQPTWDGGQTWNGGSVWDGLFTAAQYADMVQALKDASSAHSVLWGLILATDSTKFQPTGTPTTYPSGATSLPAGNWGYVIDPNTGDPTREPSGVFAYDLGQG